jgi:hypothetical protein
MSKIVAEGGFCVQPKRHPRDFFSDGRVRVQLKKEDGTPVVAAIPNSEHPPSQLRICGVVATFGILLSVLAVSG